jgi:hypothetical protein
LVSLARAVEQNLISDNFSFVGDPFSTQTVPLIDALTVSPTKQNAQEDPNTFQRLYAVTDASSSKRATGDQTLVSQPTFIQRDVLHVVKNQRCLKLLDIINNDSARNWSSCQFP